MESSEVSQKQTERSATPLVDCVPGQEFLPTGNPSLDLSAAWGSLDPAAAMEQNTEMKTDVFAPNDGELQLGWTVKDEEELFKDSDEEE